MSILSDISKQQLLLYFTFRVQTSVNCMLEDSRGLTNNTVVRYLISFLVMVYLSLLAGFL